MILLNLKNKYFNGIIDVEPIIMPYKLLHYYYLFLLSYCSGVNVFIVNA